jgi:hypothetical protein
MIASPTLLSVEDMIQLPSEAKMQDSKTENTVHNAPGTQK